MKVRSFGIFYLMGSVFAKIKLFLDALSQSEAKSPKRKSKKRAKRSNMQEDKSTHKASECNENDKDSLLSDSFEEVKIAKEKVLLLEEQLEKQKTLMDEHQAKIVLLEQLIKRQCLILKENDDNFTYEQLARSSTETASDSLTFWDRIEKQLNSMIEKKEGKATDNPDLAKIKYEFEAQRLQLQEHGECIKKHEEGLEDQLMRIETMREILDENSNHSGRGNGVKMILEDHEKRLTALEDRMAVYEKQVEKRLAEQHQLLVFTWVGLITTFVLCFAIVCSCCWFR